MRFKNLNLFILFFLIIFSLTIHNFPVNAFYNYNIDQNNIYGKFNDNGTKNSLLNHPRDIFLTNETIIVSDTDNGRILELNKLDWKLNKLIYPYFDNSGLTTNISKIYESIYSNKGYYFSLTENFRIIKYNTSGYIFASLQLPTIEHFEQINYYSIGLGTDSENSFILLKYPIKDNLNIIKIGIFSIDETLQNSSINLIYSSTEINENSRFSYQNNLPFMTEYTSDNSIKFMEFYQNTTTNSIKIINKELAYKTSYALAQLTNSFVYFMKGYLFVTTSTSYITDEDLNNAGELNTLIGQTGSFYVSKAIYDKNSDLIILSSEKNNIVLGITFLEIIQDIDTKTIDTNPTTLSLEESLIVFLFDLIPVFILIIFTVILLFVYKKFFLNKKDDSVK